MTEVLAKVNGAVSVVNAIAIGKGATLGIDTFVETRLKKRKALEYILHQRIKQSVHV